MSTESFTTFVCRRWALKTHGRRQACWWCPLTTEAKLYFHRFDEIQKMFRRVLMKFSSTDSLGSWSVTLWKRRRQVSSFEEKRFVSPRNLWRRVELAFGFDGKGFERWWKPGFHERILPGTTWGTYELILWANAPIKSFFQFLAQVWGPRKVEAKNGKAEYAEIG